MRLARALPAALEGPVERAFPGRIHHVARQKPFDDVARRERRADAHEQRLVGRPVLAVQQRRRAEEFREPGRPDRGRGLGGEGQLCRLV